MSILLKLALSLSLLGATAGVAGLGAFAEFTSSTTAVSQTMTTGKVAISLDGTAGLSIAASGLVPGDTIQRPVTLLNKSTADLGEIALTTSATGNSVLANLLRMTIEKCSGAWTPSTTTQNKYECSTSAPVVLAERAAVVSGVALSNLTLTPAVDAIKGDPQYLLVTVKYPLGSALQGESTTINYTFTATQRAGTYRP